MVHVKLPTACNSLLCAGVQGMVVLNGTVTTPHVNTRGNPRGHKMMSSIRVAVIHDQIYMIESKLDSSQICRVYVHMKTCSACMINMQQVKRSRPTERGVEVLCNHEDSSPKNT